MPTITFASIHSNPPGIATQIPTDYDESSIDFGYEDGYVKFEVSDLDIFEMYKIVI